jgi:hypothetical protein
MNVHTLGMMFFHILFYGRNFVYENRIKIFRTFHGIVDFFSKRKCHDKNSNRVLDGCY